MPSARAVRGTTSPTARAADSIRPPATSSWAISIILGVLAVALGIGHVLGGTKQWLDSQAVAGTISALLVCILVALGQGMVAFDVRVYFGSTNGAEFDGYDFWKGVDSLAKRDSMLLAVLMGGLSGVWPYVKQALTVVALCVKMKPTTQHRVLKSLGIAGKTALADISILVCIVTLVQLDVSPKKNPGLGAEGFAATQPREGALTLLIGLLLGRVLTSVLIYRTAVAVEPQRPVATHQVDHSKSSLPAVSLHLGWSVGRGRLLRIFLFAISIAAPVLTITGFCLDAVSNEVKIELWSGSKTSPTNPIILYKDLQTYTMWSLFDGCRTAANSEELPLRTFMSILVIALEIVCGGIYSLCPLLAMTLAGTPRCPVYATRLTRDGACAGVYACECVYEHVPAVVKTCCIRSKWTPTTSPARDHAFPERMVQPGNDDPRHSSAARPDGQVVRVVLNNVRFQSRYSNRCQALLYTRNPPSPIPPIPHCFSRTRPIQAHAPSALGYRYGALWQQRSDKS